MLLRGRKNQKQTQQAKSSKSLINNRDQAATKIQCLIRRFLARIRIRIVARKVWERVFDPMTKRYFWYNNLDGESYWKQPKFVDLYTSEDIAAAVKLEKLVRGFIGRMRARKKACGKYTRYYDAKTGKFYWYDKTTDKTSYNVSNWLVRQNIPLPAEDQLLYDSQLKIKELEEKLRQKDREIVEIRKQRYEELEPQMILDKVTAAKSLKRPKDMDEWGTDDLAAWFTQMKMDEYIPTLFKNRYAVCSATFT